MNRASRHRGFTLVEIAAVVVILGLLASAATLSVVRLAQRSTLEDAVRGLADFDAAARLVSTHDSEVVTLRVDERKQTVTRETRAGLRTFIVPRGVELIDVEASPSSIQLRDGVGPTYAITLASNDEAVTLLFAGVGGQVSQHEREGDVDAIFANLQ
ncbi:MAG: prepilin-type N-terminal cleavage/methylation domain-containing protein [Planctomycetota bacterium]